MFAIPTAVTPVPPDDGVYRTRWKVLAPWNAIVVVPASPVGCVGGEYPVDG
jgi:hypothetical protein